MRLALLFAVLLVSPPTTLFAQDPTHLPDLDGYVTRAASPTDFDANGFRVLATAKTEFAEGDLARSRSIQGGPKPYIGAHILIFGKLNQHKHTISAEKVLFVPPPKEVKGNGLIEALPAPRTGDAGSRLVRADGYLILISPTTMTFTPPLAQLSTNVWIAYKGEQRADGVVVASSATLTPNDRAVREEKARNKADYDPAAVSPDASQSGASKVLVGIDPRKLPPYSDDAMQARVARIGESLVPKFQKDLPDTDPTKLHFRFQVVEESKLRDAEIWPSGVIVISKQVVSRMENDSQLAAVLAESVAGLLEDQYYRLKSTLHKAGAAYIASAAIPIAGFVGMEAASKVYAEAVRNAEDQTARVSLFLLNDAGYTLAEAPKAWWILSTKEPKPLADVKLPERAQALYHALGTTWRK
jgi:hypothetical protein